MDDDSPRGDPCVQSRNEASIWASWLPSRLVRGVDVCVLYPPDLQVVSGSLTPTTVHRYHPVGFQVKMLNQGWADAVVTTNSFLKLTDSDANSQSAMLSKTVDLPADETMGRLVFGPISVSSVATGTAYVDLVVERFDENGITDTDIFTNIGQVMILDGPHIVAAPTPDPSWTLAVSSTQSFRFHVTNIGSAAASVTSGVDYIRISAGHEWGDFNSLSAMNWPAPNTRWDGSLIGTTAARWVSSTTYDTSWEWQPYDPPTYNDAAVFDVRTAAPSVPGIYTVTFESVLQEGGLVNIQHFVYTVE
jgi:hypothetical protein